MKDYYTLDEVLTLRHQLEAEALKEGFKFENVLTNRYATGFTKGNEYKIIVLDSLERVDTTLSEQEWDALPGRKTTLKTLAGYLNQEEMKALRQQKGYVSLSLETRALLQFLLRKNEILVQLPLCEISDGILFPIGAYLETISPKRILRLRNREDFQHNFKEIQKKYWKALYNKFSFQIAYKKKDIVKIERGIQNVNNWYWQPMSNAPIFCYRFTVRRTNGSIERITTKQINKKGGKK